MQDGMAVASLKLLPLAWAGLLLAEEAEKTLTRLALWARSDGGSVSSRQDPSDLTPGRGR